MPPAVSTASAGPVEGRACCKSCAAEAVADAVLRTLKDAARDGTPFDRGGGRAQAGTKRSLSPRGAQRREEPERGSGGSGGDEHDGGNDRWRAPPPRGGVGGQASVVVAYWPGVRSRYRASIRQ